jgi:hypothetical protein
MCCDQGHTVAGDRVPWFIPLTSPNALVASYFVNCRRCGLRIADELHRSLKRGLHMAAKKRSARKSSGRKYSKGAAKAVKSAMRRRKRGTLKSGKGGKGGTVKSRKQAIAIGLSEARKTGAQRKSVAARNGAVALETNRTRRSPCVAPAGPRSGSLGRSAAG